MPEIKPKPPGGRIISIKVRGSGGWVGSSTGIELLLQTEIISTGLKTNNGVLVEAVALPWLRIFKQIRQDRNSLYEFSKHPRSFEEFIAGAYDQSGFIVELTPRSSDGGRDVIATKPGFGSIRFLEQTKAYSPNNFVTHDDVRAMIGVLSLDSNSSKGLITTTSDFQPGIKKSDEFKNFMPHRLELKNGPQTLEWLESIANGSAT